MMIQPGCFFFFLLFKIISHQQLFIKLNKTSDLNRWMMSLACLWGDSPDMKSSSKKLIAPASSRVYPIINCDNDIIQTKESGGRGRRGQQRTRWLDGITDSMDMFEPAPGVGEGQGSLAWCIHGVAELDMTGRLNNSKRDWKESLPLKNFKLGIMSPMWQSSNRVIWRDGLEGESQEGVTEMISYETCGFNIIYQEFFFHNLRICHQTTSTFPSHNFQLCLLSSKYKSAKWNHKWTGTINNLYHNPIFPAD